MSFSGLGRGRGFVRPDSSASSSNLSGSSSSAGASNAGLGRSHLFHIDSQTGLPNANDVMNFSSISADVFDQFFSVGSDFKPPEFDSSLTNGLGFISKKIKTEPPDDVKRKQPIGQEYVAEVLQREKEEAIMHQRRAYRDLDPSSMASLTSGATDLDAISTVLGEINIPQAEDVRIALQPFFDPSKRRPSQKLKIIEYKDKILNSIKMNPVTIIEGSTGCGKTTQVPQYIADDCYQRDQYFNIVVTQPRRIAAMSVAKRVCAERDWQLGEIVGYQVGMDKKTSENTKILYCTTGVLLQKLITLKKMDQFTHIIVDEVHERSEETDLLLMVVRKFMWTHHAPVRVIIMSATFDTAMLQDYFAIPNPSNVIHATVKPSVISITEKQNSVSIFYIDQMGALCTSSRGVFQCDFSVDSPCITWEAIEVAYNLIKNFDDMEKAQGQQYGKGAVLVFLPGYEEISEMKARLEGDRYHSINWWVLPLHSSITSDEQQRAFEPAVRGSRKIILATNIAESSITVTDIEYVIDFCLTKNLILDPETKYPCLRLEWASKASCTQRSGRAGRVRDGRCYRLITNEFYERNLRDYPTPELLRMPLELSVLKVKKLDLGRPKELLGLCLNPPNLSDINRAVLRLKKVGGLSVTMNGVYDEEDGYLTAVGRVMAVLPIDVQLSRLILIGHALDCLNDCCMIAACLTLQNIFSRQYNREIQAYKSKLAWADRTFSDALAYLHAFGMYNQYIQNNIFTPNSHKAKDWCNQTFIQHKRIREVDLLYKEIIQRLADLNIKLPEKPNQIRNSSEEELFLKICMCGAFYPNYFVRMDMNIDDVRKDLHDKDPRTTVKISNLPQNEGVLYANQIRRLFQECSDQINLEFEESHALLTFSSDRNPLEEARKRQEFISHRRQRDEQKDFKLRDTEVKTSVYVAMKLKQTSIPLKITLYRNDRKRDLLDHYIRVRDTRVDAQRSLRTNRFSVPAIPSVALPLTKLPRPGVKQFKLFITHIVDCGHFWAQYFTDDVRETLCNLRDAINNLQTQEVREVTPGMIVLAPYEVVPGRVEYCRARVDIVRERFGIKIFYIDYGNSEVKDDKSGLLEIPLDHPIMKTPALAFECQLSEIKPSECRTYDGSWHPEAVSYFTTAVFDRKDLKAHVYSVVNRVVRCELVVGQNLRINNELINKGYAEYHQELPLSRLDHEMRARVQSTDGSTGTFMSEVTDVVEVDVIEPENNVLSKDSIRIRGPHSPIEAFFQGITRLNYNLKVGIERDSVNSICLEPNPEESVNRLLVAASVSLGSGTSRLVARSTTLMPNIRGMVAMMSLIFAPTVEFRVDTSSKRYLGAICGLGFDSVTKNSYDRDGDVELQFDVLFSHTDIGTINTIRLKLSDTLSSDSRLTESAGPAFSKRQESIRELFLMLLNKKRIKQDIKSNQRAEFKWGLIAEHRTEKPLDEYFEDVEHPFLPLISLVKEIDSDLYIKKVIENLDELSLIARNKFSQRTHCMVCNVITYTLLDLTNHLASKSHIDHVMELFPPVSDPNDINVEPEFDFD